MEQRWGFMVLLSVQLLPARENVSHSCLFFFFPFKSYFWLNEGENLRAQPIVAEAAAHTDGAWNPAWFHWFSLAFPVGSGNCLSLSEWAPTLRGTFARSAPSIPSSSAGGQQQRLGLTPTWTAKSTGTYPLLHPLPSRPEKIAGDDGCLRLLRLRRGKVGVRWSAACWAALRRGMRWSDSCGDHWWSWGRAGMPAQEQEGLVSGSKLVSVLARNSGGKKGWERN